MGDWRREAELKDQTSLILPKQPVEPAVTDDGPNLSSLINTEDVVFKWYPSINLELEDKILTSFWVAEGRWTVRAYFNMLGGGGLVCNAIVTLKAEAGDKVMEQPVLGTVGGKNSKHIGGQFSPASGQAMLISAAARRDAQGTCSISDMTIVALKDS